jgi:hypothetical protein
MGVYIEVRLENGMPLASIEITRAHDQAQPEHSMPPMLPGEYRYNFKAQVKSPASMIDWHFEDSISHERTEDVLALLSAVIGRVQEMQAGLT